MEIETIAKVGGSYNSSESKAVKVEPVDVAPVATPKDVAVKTVESTGNAGDRHEDDQKGGKERRPSEATIRDAVSSANRRMERTRCEYSYHKETNRVSIKVFDADTDEVIREIPPEKSLEMLQKMWEMAGILVDEKR